MIDLDVTSVVNRCVTVISLTLIASMFCSCISENIKSCVEIAQINASDESKKLIRRDIGQSSSTPEYAFTTGLHNTTPAANPNPNGIFTV